MSSTYLHLVRTLLCTALIFEANFISAQHFCATDRIHEELMATDSIYAAQYALNNHRLSAYIQSKSLDLDNSTMVTIPLVVHVMHTGGAVGSAYNPSDQDIIDMIDGLNDFYANANGLGVDINIEFALAQRDENCSASNGINRVDASGITDYAADGLDAGSGIGADEVTVKALSKWNNVDYYNIWIVNKIEGHDGTTGGSFTAGYAYYPGANTARDGTVMLASQLDPTDITLAHEIGHALNLLHTFYDDGTGSTCPTDDDCTTNGDRCCDTPAHKRNQFNCITSGNTCHGEPVGDVYKNFMCYSLCQDRFTNDQRTRMRAALEISRPGLVSSLGDEPPSASSATAACTPGINNSGNFGIGSRQFDFGDNRIWTSTQGSSGYSHYIDLACNQEYSVYPGQEIPVSVGTSGVNLHRIKIYADFNDNGTLDDSGELVFDENSSSNPDTQTATVEIDPDAVTGTPLRVRLWVDFIGSGGQNGPCGNLGYGQAIDFSLRVEDVDIWEGTVSSDWSNGSNWAKGSAPTSSGNVRISSSAPNQPRVTASPGSPAVCNNLEIQSGASLTIEAGKALTVNGTTENDGTILIESDATGIGSLITNGAISGSGACQMEQYLTGSGGATPNGLFYYVGSPVGNALTYDYNVDTGDKLWAADEVTQSYPQQTVGAVSLVPMKGYVARMGSTQTITFNEVGNNTHFNTGNLSATGLTRTGTTEANRGYNLVGNPYPSTVNWGDLGRTNLETTMWYRTHQGTTMLYDTYNAISMIGTNNNGGGAVDGTIPPTQAFWVRVDADGNTGQIDFANEDRSHGTLAGIYKTEAEEGTVRMTLSNGAVSDETIVMFNADAEDVLDDFDSRKFWAAQSVPQLYTADANDTLVINGLNSTLTNPTVPLGMKLPAQGSYTLNASDITLVGETVHLEDTYLNVFQDLGLEPTYSFTSDAGNIGNRFVLHFGLTVTGVDEAGNSSRVYFSNGQLNIILPENVEKGNVQVLDMAGRVVSISNLSSTRTTLEMNVATGAYLIRLNTSTGIDTHKIILQ